MRLAFLPVLALAAALGATPVLAEKGEHPGGGGKHGHKADKHADKEQRKADKRVDKQERKEAKHGGRHDGDDDRRASRHGRRDDGPRHGAYFDDRHRESVRHYYTSYSGQRCPPGLAKKNNGCMPPGQARKWQVGHRLPANVIVYSVPQPILVVLPPPPPHHRYVRVAGDILLIALGTQMVVDGISGLVN